MACCVCGLRQAWGKLGSTEDIIDKKNKIRNHHSYSPFSPLTLHQPAIPKLTSFLQFPSHPFLSLLCLSLPLHFCSLIKYHTPIATLQSNYPNQTQSNSLSALLSKTFLNSIHFNIIMSTVYLVFIWHSLKQMVYWLRNTFIHVSVNMSEVLCTCWG